MRSFRCALGALAYALCTTATSTALAAIVPFSQTREISATAWGTNAIGDAKSASASNFDQFKASVSAKTSPTPNPAPPPNWLEGGEGNASASQDSSITSTKITTSGSGGASGYGNHGLDGGGSFASTFHLVFNLTQPSSVTLTGAANWFDMFTPLATIYLAGPGGQLAQLVYTFGKVSGTIK